MTMGIFGIGISGLNTAQAGMATAGHNISNAATPGFSRQEVLQTTNAPSYSGAGFIGQGVEISTVRRIYSEVLNNQLAAAQSLGGAYGSYAAQIGQVANLLADPQAGLSPRLHDFFAAVADVAAHPESVPSRQTLLSSAQALVASFQGLDQQLQEIRNAVNTEVQSGVELLNSYAQQIAQLNHDIQFTEAASGAQPANDLRDLRDQLVAQLGEQVNVSVVRQGDGSYNVFIGNGQPVVVGAKPFTLVAAPSPYDPQRLALGLQAGGGVVMLPEAGLQGGKLGGLLAFRTETLDSVQNALGRVALGLGQAFNTQHALGQDLGGLLGGDFFALASPAVNFNSTNQGTGNLTVSLGQADALTVSDYRLAFQGINAGNDRYVLTRLSDGRTTTLDVPSGTGYPAGFSVDGLQLTLDAGAVSGDSWEIRPTRSGAAGLGLLISDPARIAAASPLRSAAELTNRGNATVSAPTLASTAGLPLPADIRLTFDAASTSFVVSGAVPAVAPIAYQAGTAITLGGVSFSISGQPQDGDQFTLSSNTQGVSDNRNALALAALQTVATLGRDASLPGASASSTLQSAYAQIVSQVGSKARQMEVSQQAQTQIIAQTRQAQQAVSGVNLDEEAANLLRYQQMYQASGKVLQIANTLFDTVLQLGR